MTPTYSPAPWPSGFAEIGIRVPGSKSITNRALPLAAVARGETLLTGALASDDTRVMIEALRALGIEVDHDEANRTLRVQGCGGRFPAAEADLFLGNSGTSLRFLTALVCAGRGKYRLDGVPRMRQRPVDDLLLALDRLGADVRSELGTGCPPVLVVADGLDGGDAYVKGDVSSQFLSGLLMALPLAKGPSSLFIEGELVSKPYVEMTLTVMEAFGNDSVTNRKFRRFDVLPATYQGREYEIEPDASAASYWMALAAVRGGTVAIEGLGAASLQGDMAFAELLRHMGCTVEQSADLTVIKGGAGLRGIDVDMNAISDTVMTLAVVALFADGMTRIRNVGHIRHKETDRIAALATELRKFGAEVTEHPDGFAITPPAKVIPASVATYDDHRMAMSFAIAGTVIPGVVIQDPGCVAKTYPEFWADLERLHPGPGPVPVAAAGN
jgi:3-phosphoshikimate 1-carboxyvinyltransferase